MVGERLPLPVARDASQGEKGHAIAQKAKYGAAETAR
jgi:hypothetical protein